MIDEAPVAPKPRARGKRKRWINQRSEFWVRLLTALFTPVFRFWVRYFRWYGAENVPRSGGTFLIANHTTGMDPFLIGFSLRHRHIRGPGRIELFSNPVAGYIMRKMGMFPLRQRMADAVGIRVVVELIRGGDLVTVFPEGGRSPNGTLQEFNTGFTRLALRMQAPLVPMAIAGGRDLLPIGKYLPQRNTAVVAMYGEPFDLSEFAGLELTPEIIEQATQIMRERVVELLARAEAERLRLVREHGLKTAAP